MASSSTTVDIDPALAAQQEEERIRERERNSIRSDARAVARDLDALITRAVNLTNDVQTIAEGVGNDIFAEKTNKAITDAKAVKTGLENL